MSSSAKVLFVFLLKCSLSLQQPFLTRSSYKGLAGVVPVVRVHAYGHHRAVYYHEQTVAVVDINEKNEMQNCDVIEVYEPSEATEVLGNLSMASRPMEITFSQMTSLMFRCEVLDTMLGANSREKNVPRGALERANILGTHAINIFAGIVPGTKWCGTGDVASNYHDLGIDADTDRCCRTHDLCPVKIRAQHSRYNLTNYSLYSKSHCECDSALYYCLKSVGGPTANIMGKVYFNIVRVSCIEDLPDDRSTVAFSEPVRRFVETQRSF